MKGIEDTEDEDVEQYEEEGPGGIEGYENPNPESTEEISPDALESVPGEPLVKRKRRNRKKKDRESRQRRKTKVCIDENGVQHIINRVRRDTDVQETFKYIPGPPVT